MGNIFSDHFHEHEKNALMVANNSAMLTANKTTPVLTTKTVGSAYTPSIKTDTAITGNVNIYDMKKNLQFHQMAVGSSTAKLSSPAQVVLPQAAANNNTVTTQKKGLTSNGVVLTTTTSQTSSASGGTIVSTSTTPITD
jgi:hypothetical protein